MAKRLNTAHPDWAAGIGDGSVATAVEAHGNGNESLKVIFGGTHYDAATPRRVVERLQDAMDTRNRLYIEYGNTETGQAWGAGAVVRGTIGRSMGPIKIPLHIANARSHGGPGLLEGCIVKITSSYSKAVLYKHPTYKPADERIYFAALTDWAAIATALSGSKLRETIEDSVTRAGARGVKRCELWFGGDDIRRVQEAAGALKIALATRDPRY